MKKSYKIILPLLVTMAAVMYQGCKKESKDPGSSTAVKVGDDKSIVIMKDGTALYTFKKTGDTWAALSGALKGEIVKSGSGYLLTFNSLKFSVRLKDGSYKLSGPDTALTLKFSGKKYKFYLDGDKSSAWSFKAKDNGQKYKASLGGKESGMVKYYPDKKKVAAKDENGTEQCRSKSDRLILSPGVCLIKNFSEKDRFLSFVLMSIRDVEEN